MEDTFYGADTIQGEGKRQSVELQAQMSTWMTLGIMLSKRVLSRSVGGDSGWYTEVTEQLRPEEEGQRNSLGLAPVLYGVWVSGCVFGRGDRPDV